MSVSPESDTPSDTISESQIVDAGYEVTNEHADEAMANNDEIGSEDKVRLMAATADAVRAEDIVALDLRELTIIADFFLICTGKSSIQIRAVADRIEEKLRD